MVSANQSCCSGLQLGLGKDQGRLPQAIHNALALAFPDYIDEIVLSSGYLAEASHHADCHDPFRTNRLQSDCLSCRTVELGKRDELSSQLTTQQHASHLYGILFDAFFITSTRDLLPSS